MHNDTTGIDPEQIILAHREEIEAAMARHFAGATEPSSADRQAASELVGLVVTSLGNGATAPAQLTSQRRYQSPFGDGLTPVLRDILGDRAEVPFLARCIDGFWRAVRTLDQLA